MPKENDLEGKQDMGGRHGGQAGMPEPENKPGIARDSSSRANQGIVRDKKGQEQPAEKARAQQASRG